MNAFAWTIGVAAFLLFQVQPILARFILTWFSGAATGPPRARARDLDRRPRQPLERAAGV